MENRVIDTYHQIQQEIHSLLMQAGRAANSCQLLLASKQQSAETIKKLLAAGHHLFGENYVQEALEKWPVLRQAYPSIKLHLIGPLQTNKIADALSLFDVIESLDRPKLAQALAKEQQKQHLEKEYFVQVNTGNENQKSGISPQKTQEFVHFCQNLGLKVKGLMAIPPADQHPAPHFSLLYQLGQRCGLKELSMGMSQDYPIAIRLGSTELRLGTKIFGPRPSARQE